MKPKKLPKQFEDDWQEWPTLDAIEEKNRDLKRHALRAVLAPVPCYRCEDNSVRYDPEMVEAAIAGRLTAADDDERAELSDELRRGAVPELTMLMRELGRMVADARKEKNDTIRVMETPLRVGVALMEQAMALMAGRLKHYDELWDGMIETSERLKSHEADREIAKAKEAQQVEMRKNLFGLVQSQLPAMMANFQLAKDGKLALELVRSLEGPILDQLSEDEVLSPEARAIVQQFRAQKPPAEKPQQNEQSQAAE